MGFAGYTQNHLNIYYIWTKKGDWSVNVFLFILLDR